MIPSCGAEHHNYFTTLPIAWNLLLGNKIKRPKWLHHIWSVVPLTAFPGVGFCIRSPRGLGGMYVPFTFSLLQSLFCHIGTGREGRDAACFRSAWLSRFMDTELRRAPLGQEEGNGCFMMKSEQFINW